MADGILTPCNVARSRHWFRQVTAPCNVVCGSALESWQCIHQVAAPCIVIHGSGMTCHWIRPNVCHIEILLLVSISTHHRSRHRHVILCQSAKFYPNRTTLMMSCRFSRWRISAILDCRDPIMGSLKSPCATSYRSSIETIALNCLVFEKISFLYFGDRQTTRRANRWTAPMH